jgi:hypothetical protein
LVDTPPSHRGGGGFFAGIFGLLWARPTIAAAALAAGVFIGLNLAPDASGPPSPEPSAVAVQGTAPGALPAPAPSPSTPTASPPAAGPGALVPQPESPLQPARLAGTAAPLTIGVFGDSLGDGVWAGLYRDLHGDKSLDVLRLSQVSTGISRYNYVDIQAKTAAQLAARHVDIAVVMFGANDQQGIVDGGGIYPFGTDGWRAAYGRRVDKLVQTLRAQGAVVYWMGLPKMERDGFDRGAALINVLLQQHMAADGAVFVPTEPLTVDAQGRYSAYLPGPGGERRLMRANDGVHMSMAGYLRIAEPVAALIKRSVAGARAAVATPVTEPVTAPGGTSLDVNPADNHP